MVRLLGRAGGARPGRKKLTLVHPWWWAPPMSTTPMCCARGWHRAGRGPSGDGALDARHVPAGVHLRTCPPARGGGGRGGAPGVGAGRRAGLVPVGDRCGLHRVRGRGPPQAGGGVRLHQGARLPPILASRADTGEVVHARLRTGSANTARGARRFLDELIARVRRAGASGEIVFRMDSGFWVQRHHRLPGPARCPLHDGGAHRPQEPRRGHRHHRRG